MITKEATEEIILGEQTQEIKMFLERTDQEDEEAIPYTEIRRDEILNNISAVIILLILLTPILGIISFLHFGHMLYPTLIPFFF